MNGKVLPGDVHEHAHTTLGTLFHGFIHPSLKTRPAVDQALIDSAGGRASVAQAAAALVVAALIQFVLAFFSQSTALVAGGLIALAAAATAIPVFTASSGTVQQTSKLFPYGRERSEDLLIVLATVAIAVVALGVGILAAVRLAFFMGAENPILLGAAGIASLMAHGTAAVLRISAGRTVKSATLSADGRAAMWSGVTGLIVILVAIAVARGQTWADSVAGVVMAAFLFRNLWRSAQPATTRLIDGIEEDLTWRLARAAEEAGAVNVVDVRARWAGHCLHAEITVGVASDTVLAATRPLAGRIRAETARKFPQLKRVVVLFVPVDPGTTPSA